MGNRLRRKDKNRKVINILAIPVFFILAFIAIRVGTIGGDFLFSMDAKIVRGIDAENFKTTLNKSFPIIDTVYNSGNISISLSGELKTIVKRIFNFDLNSSIIKIHLQEIRSGNCSTNGRKKTG